LDRREGKRREEGENCILRNYCSPLDDVTMMKQRRKDRAVAIDAHPASEISVPKHPKEKRGLGGGEEGSTVIPNIA
jgi:hypothetical protein